MLELFNPLHLDSDGNLMQFDVIVANMPFSQDKWAAGFNTGGLMAYYLGGHPKADKTSRHR